VVSSWRKGVYHTALSCPRGNGDELLPCEAIIGDRVIMLFDNAEGYANAVYTDIMINRRFAGQINEVRFTLAL
jgi:hypothetical protein